MPAKKETKPAAAKATDKAPAKAAATKAPAKAPAKTEKKVEKAPKAVAKKTDKPAAKSKGDAKKGLKGGKKGKNPLFIARPRVFGIGQDLPPKRDMTRFVKWPRYVRIQRQRRILLTRLKVPPTLNQFRRTLDKNSTKQLIALLMKHRPETKVAKKQRLLKAAAKEAGKDAGKKDSTKPPAVVKFGLNHITQLVENKQAKLVAIAHDVNPIELVVWLPTLCKKQGIPYCIVKSKSELGKIVHQKTATAVALTRVADGSQQELTQLADLCKDAFNENADLRKQWGGNKLGNKTLQRLRKQAKAVKRQNA